MISCLSFKILLMYSRSYVSCRIRWSFRTNDVRDDGSPTFDTDWNKGFGSLAQGWFPVMCTVLQECAPINLQDNVCALIWGICANLRAMCPDVSVGATHGFRSLDYSSNKKPYRYSNFSQIKGRVTIIHYSDGSVSPREEPSTCRQRFEIIR